jgi:hypothetical protein
MEEHNMQESGSSSQPASITTPAQAARMPPPDFQALAFAVLHNQSQDINRLAEQVSAFMREEHAAAHAAAPAASVQQPPQPPAAPAPMAASNHLDFALTFASPLEASFMDKMLSQKAHTEFHGTGANVGSTLEHWFDEYDALFSLDPRFRTEAHKLLYSALHLKEDALRWLLNRERAQQYPPPGTVPPAKIETWTQLKVALREYFCPRGSSDEARRELHRLRQSDFSTLDGYIARFQSLSANINVPLGQSIEPELISAFKDGLRDGRVKLAITQQAPTTFFLATQIARNTDTDLNASRYGAYASHERDHSRQRYHSGPSWHSRPSASSSPYYSSSRSYNAYGQGGSSHNSGSAPMELGAIDEQDETGPWRVEADGTNEQSAAGDMSSSEPPQDDCDRPASEHEEDDDSPSRYAGSGSPSEREERFLSTARSERTEANALFRPGRGRDRRQPYRGGGNYRSGSTSSTRERFLQQNECWNCGRTGHFLRDCQYQRNRDPGDGGAQGGSSSSHPQSGGNRGAQSYHAKKM